MDSDSGYWLYLIILVVFLIANAIVAHSEVSIVSLNDGKVKKKATSGDKKSKRLMKMIDNPSQFKASISLFYTMMGFLISAFTIEAIGDKFTYLIFASAEKLPKVLLVFISYLILSLVFSIVVLVFSINIPKRLAQQDYERYAYRHCNIIYLKYLLVKPIIAIINFISNGVLRLLGIDPSKQVEEVTEEEIRMMIDVGNEIGSIEKSEKDMIHNIFEFDNRDVDEIMTHRTDIVGIEKEATLDEVVNLAISEGYSRIPVYEDDIDNIIGVLYIKDLLKIISDRSRDSFEVEKYMRKALYVPETNNCKDLFVQFQETRKQFAVIVDEYGGTAGIVTMEDIIESVMGNIQDEYDNEEEEFIKIDDYNYIINGMYPIEKIENFFDIKFYDEDDADADDDYDTLSGFITTTLGRIPAVGEQPEIRVDNILFKTLEIEEHHIEKVKVTILNSEVEE